jgi:hypothetical protein
MARAPLRTPNRIVLWVGHLSRFARGGFPTGAPSFRISPRQSLFLPQAGVNAKTFGGLTESLIFCPQKR